MPSGGRAAPNRLVTATSPYLLQHAYNPVDWYPWGPEALERSRREDRPILLSIGYAACHWCHVMEHESFEDPEIAALMNDNFVCIKVDREERPDLDEIYMSAVQLMTGQGGWPMTMFLTPDLKPFHGGTYFPPEDRYQHPGMRRLIPEVARIYRERRADVEEQAAEISRVVGRISAGDGGPPGPLTTDLVDDAAVQLLSHRDTEWGGFGGAPKFPPSMGLSLLLRYRQRTGEAQVEPAVRLTLERMALGGLYDALGGGFARYSVDDRWQVPHFEKMLYDNALLVAVYAEALLALGDDRGLYARTIRQTLDFVDRELSDPAGGFYSSLDADSEGEEGKFYVWTADEIRAVLGTEAEFFREMYDVTWEGNWEQGHSVLWVTPPRVAAAAVAEPRLAPLRAKLLAVRDGRVRPGLDDKVLAAWNGLMISACCRAAQALDEPHRAERAARAAEFVLGQMMRDGRLLRSWRRGAAGLMAYNEDYAFLADGLIDLYETTFEPRWLAAAAELADAALRHYRDPAAGGFFLTAADAENLLHRPRTAYDGATPSGNSILTRVLLRLAVLLDRPDYRAEAERTLQAFAGRLRQTPAAHHRMLAALDAFLQPAVEVAVIGPLQDEATRALLRTVWGAYVPDRVIAARAATPMAAGGAIEAPPIPLLAGKTLVDGAAAAYVCTNFTCAAPVTSPDALRRGLGIPSPRK